MTDADVLRALLAYAEREYGISERALRPRLRVTRVQANAVTALSAAIYLEERTWADHPADIAADGRDAVPVASSAWFQPFETVAFSAPYQRPCLACGASGGVCAFCKGRRQVTCDACGGGGRIIHTYVVYGRYGPETRTDVFDCTACNLTGVLGCACSGPRVQCAACRACGVVDTPRELRVRRWTERFDEQTVEGIATEVLARMPVAHSVADARVDPIAALQLCAAGPYRSSTDATALEAAQRLAAAIDTSGLDPSIRVLAQRVEIRTGRVVAAVCEADEVPHEVVWVDDRLLESPLWLAGLE